MHLPERLVQLAAEEGGALDVRFARWEAPTVDPSDEKKIESLPEAMGWPRDWTRLPIQNEKIFYLT